MTSSRKFHRLLQAGCLGLIGTLAAAGCGGSSSGKKDVGVPDGGYPEGGVLPGATAVLTVTPVTLPLGEIDVGSTSTPANITVTNSGYVASGPLSVSLVGVTPGAGLSVAGCNGAPLAVGKSCTIAVTAKPTVAGPIGGSVQISDGSAAQPKSVLVDGMAVTQGLFSLTPTPLDLGPVVVGKTVSGTITLTNNSNTGLTDITTVVGGNGFTAGTGGTCTGALPQSQSCTIVINFAAAASAVSGVARGTLTVSQGGTTKTVALSATVQTPCKLLITPPTATFLAAVGETSKQTFYVGNVGDIDCAVPTVTITPAAATDFSFTSDCTSTGLAGGAKSKCDVVVTYTPKAATATDAKATLTVAEPAPGSSASASLVGTAVLPSTLAITGTSTDLGLVVVGNTGTALTFTVTNKGGEASGAIAVTAAPGQFIASNDCEGKDLAPAATCTFTAQFKPANGDAGVVQGQLKATGAKVENPAFLMVSGTAVPQAKLAAEPKVLEFGSVPTLQESAPLTLVISNVGGAPTGALKVENSGAQFAIKANTCANASLTAAGASKTCSIVVTFTSTATDTEATGNIIVTDTTGAAGSVTASLHGTGIPHPAVVMAPQVVCPEYVEDDPLCTPRNAGFHQGLNRFNDVVIGQTTPEMVFTIYNTTDPKDAPDSGDIKFELSGVGAADYAIVKNTCKDAPLTSTSAFATAPTSCIITLTFTPSAAGLRNALLKLTTTRGGIAQTTLEGKGLPVLELQPLPVGTADYVKDDPSCYDMPPMYTCPRHWLVTKIPGQDGLGFGQVALGHDVSEDQDPQKGIHPFRAWVRSTSQADHNTTVTIVLPTPNPADFVWPTVGTTTTVINGKTDDGIVLTPPTPDPSDASAGSKSVYMAAQTNPCGSKLLSLAVDPQTKKPTDVVKAGNAPYLYDDHSGYWYCDFGVQFYPQSARGPLGADLTASATGGGASKLSLTGTATGPLVITPSPAILHDPVAVGMSADPTETYLTLTITNQGAVDQKGLSFALSGTNAGDFQIAGTDCWCANAVNGQCQYSAPAPLPQAHAYIDLKAVVLPGHGGSCHVWLGFEPKVEGPYSVTFTATAANGEGTADDETGSDTIIATSSNTFGPLTVTPNPATSSFGDVAFSKNNATPVTFTIKNTGTLAASHLGWQLDGDDPNDFEVLPTAGVAGACSTDAAYLLAGGASCTIQVRAKPTATTYPDGVKKHLITADLVVNSDPAGAVIVPLAYYETSNIMVKDTGAAASVIAFDFGKAGFKVATSHDFQVTNVGSDDVTLDFATMDPPAGTPVLPVPYSLADDAEVTPALCKTDANWLKAGQSCTLRVKNSNDMTDPSFMTSEGLVISAENPAVLHVKNTKVTNSEARIKLSSVTVPPAKIGLFGQPAAVAMPVATVPMTGAKGGIYTIPFENKGDTVSGNLTYTWFVYTADAWTGTYVKTVVTATAQDEEFAILGFGETLTKPLAPGELRNVQVQFTPSASRFAIPYRNAVLFVSDAPILSPGLPGQVYVQFPVYLGQISNLPTWDADFYVEELGSHNAGFFQFTKITPAGGTPVALTPEVGHFRIWNKSGTAQTAVVTVPTGFAFAETQPTGNCGNLTGTSTTTSEIPAGGSCLVDLVFKPSLGGSLSQDFRFQQGVLQVDPTGPSSIVYLGLLGRQELPATLGIRKDPLASGSNLSHVVFYGTVVVGGSKAQTLTVTNLGDLAMPVESPALGAAVLGTLPDVYPVGFAVTTDGCNGARLAKLGDAGDKCQITVTATGKLYAGGAGGQDTIAVGPATGSVPASTGFYLVVNSVLKAAAVAIDGTAVFETTPVTGHHEHSFTVSNGTGADSVPTGVLTASLTGTNADQFAIVGNNLPPNIGLDSGDSATVVVRFVPTKLSADSNAFTATLNVFDANVSATVPVKSLAIQGTPRSALLSSPEGVGTTLPKTIAMNAPAQEIEIGLVDKTVAATAPLKTTLTGADFMLVDDTCYGKILDRISHSCWISVKYIGRTTSTAKTATLKVDGGDADTLSGRSVTVVVSYTGEEAQEH